MDPGDKHRDDNGRRTAAMFAYVGSFTAAGRKAHGDGIGDTVATFRVDAISGKLAPRAQTIEIARPVTIAFADK